MQSYNLITSAQNYAAIDYGITGSYLLLVIFGHLTTVILITTGPTQYCDRNRQKCDKTNTAL